MGKRLSIAVTCPDRFGLVRDVTSALAEIGLNLRDTTFANLEGETAELVAVCEGPDDVDEDAVRKTILNVPGAEGGTVLVGAFEMTSTHKSRGDRITHRLEMHGADIQGLVSKVTSLINSHNGFVVRLSTSLMPIPGSDERTTVRVSIQIDDEGAEACRIALAEMAKDLGLIHSWTKM